MREEREAEHENLFSNKIDICEKPVYDVIARDVIMPKLK